MNAALKILVPEKVYHVSEVRNRDSIAEFGVDHTKSTTKPRGGYAEGNYFWETLEMATMFAKGRIGTWDIWIIPTVGLFLSADPTITKSYYIDEAVKQSGVHQTITVEP